MRSFIKLSTTWLVVLVAFSLFLVGCSGKQSNSSQVSSGDDASSKTNQSPPAGGESTPEELSEASSEDVVFNSLEDMPENLQAQLRTALLDVGYMDFDSSTTEVGSLLYNFIIGPASTSFWSLYSTGDSEEDYRRYIYEDGADPRKLFHTYGKFDAKSVDWMLQNIYHVTPTHSSEIFVDPTQSGENFGGVLYYYENNYYVKWDSIGFPQDEISLLTLQRLEGNNYQVEYRIFSDYSEINGIAVLEWSPVGATNYWSYHKVTVTSSLTQNDAT